MSESTSVQGNVEGTPALERMRTEFDDRCLYARVTVHGVPAFCGYRAKGRDANGRPCCGIHLGKQHGILWFGNRYHHPEGTVDRGARWQFLHGSARPGGQH